MKITQAWNVSVDGEAHKVNYSYNYLTGKTVLTVDGESFSVKGKPLGIKVCRREMIMIAGSQAILDVGKNGVADIIFRDGEVTAE